MPTDKSLRNIHVFPSEDSFNQNVGSVGDGDLALVPLNIADLVYPVGSIYMSVNEVNPSTLFGGTWQKIENAFLYGSGTKAVGVTGGEENHTLTTNEMPNHSHDIGSVRSTGNFPALWRCSGTGDDPSGSFSFDRKWNAGVSHGASDDWGANFDFSFYKTSSGSVASAGGGASHNNMPPYLVVNIWKRTA